MRRSRFFASTVVVFAFAFVAAACSSDDGADTTTTPETTETTTTVAVDTTTAAAAETSAPSADSTAPVDTTAPADGEPILLTSILDENEALGQFFPESRAALAAAELFVNENGGLGGRGNPVTIEICVGEVDPNINAECGRQVAEGESIAAVGSAVCTNDTAYPILNEATPPVANIGALTCLPSTFGAPNAYWVNGGLQGAAIVEAAIACTELGSESTYLNLVDVPGIMALEPLYNATLERLGCGGVDKLITMARDQFDADPAVAQYGGSDAVMHLMAPPQPGPIINSAAQQGSESVLIFTPTNMSNVIIEATGENSEGVMVARWYRAPDSGAPGYEALTEYLGKVDGSQYIYDEFGTMAWVAVMALDQAFRDCPACELTREGAIEAMNGLSGFTAGDIAPPMDFTKPSEHPLVETFPRLGTLQGFAGIIEDGAVVTFGDGEALP